MGACPVLAKREGWVRLPSLGYMYCSIVAGGSSSRPRSILLRCVALILGVGTVTCEGKSWGGKGVSWSGEGVRRGGGEGTSEGLGGNAWSPCHGYAGMQPSHRRREREAGGSGASTACEGRQ